MLLKRYSKEVPFFNERYTRRAPFLSKWYTKGLGVGPQGGSYTYETLKSAPRKRWLVAYFCNANYRSPLTLTHKPLIIHVGLGNKQAVTLTYALTSYQRGVEIRYNTSESFADKQ